jgi:hypothetical protein
LATVNSSQACHIAIVIVDSRKLVIIVARLIEVHTIMQLAIDFIK